MQNYPLSTVGILIFSSFHRILLVKSHKWKNHYTVPGGKIELGERCCDAARREVKEETNLDIVNLQFALFQECVFSEEFWKKKHLIMHDFVAELKPGISEADVRLNDEAETFVWAAPEEVSKLDLTFETRQLWTWAAVHHYPEGGRNGFRNQK